MLSVTSIVSFPQIAPFRGGVAARDSLAAPVAGAPDTSGAVVGARSAPSVSRLAPESVAGIQEDAGGNQPEARQGSADEKAADEKSGAAAEDAQGLTEADRRKIEKLKQRDREVREHERAHATAGGSIAGSPSFTFVSGPDGKQYAVGGEVSIDVSPVSGNPQATIRKMEQVKRAALAPANPSGQDRRVASQADAAIVKAKQELAAERREELENQSSGEASGLDGSDNSIGRSDPVFDPQKRFRQPVGGASIPLGSGLAGSGELKINVGLTNPGDLLNMIA
ncbi:MAG: putative metalloprotease CJM1_0395 family protein [Proteobacteria bacterium]|nr:putative metalloprotease CJM1_0395 family protein [Pseudomonadota bacterium]